MLPLTFARLLLVALPAQPPVPADPPQFGPITIRKLEDAVVKLPDGFKGPVKFEAVKTADGARVNMTLGDIKLEATRLQIETATHVITMEAELSNGKAVISTESRLLPGQEPLVIPKRP